MAHVQDVESIWSDFLNPDILRRRFVTAGLFIVAYERLEEAVKKPLFEFFATHWTAEKGWEESPKYAKEVRALDPKGKSDAFRGSVCWLCQNGIIDWQDEATIRKVKDARNIFAHELSSIVSGSGSRPDFEELFPPLVCLIIKIERWWIINVEMAVDEEFCSAEIEPDSVMPPSMLFLQILEMVALGDDQQAWELYNKFNEGAK